MTAPITLSSLDDLSTHLLPSTPAGYLRYLLITTLRRKGFDGAEAGALGEMERLVESHIQRLFETASEYAEHAGRQAPNAVDALVAQDEVMATKKLRRESKRRRTAIRLETAPEPSSRPQRTTLDLLVDFAADQTLDQPRDQVDSDHMDQKPDTESLHSYTTGGGASKGAVRKGEVPSYAFDWAPGLPGTWMYGTPHMNETPRPPDIEPAPKVTSGSMDFVKSTTVVGENIPPELGIVHFLKTGDRSKRRRAGLSASAVGTGIVGPGGEM